MLLRVTLRLAAKLAYLIAVAECAHLLLNGRDQTGKKRRGDVQHALDGGKIP